MHVTSNDYRRVRCPWGEHYIYTGVVVGNFAVVKWRYGDGPGVPIVLEAWTCPAATVNLFGNSCILILD